MADIDDIDHGYAVGTEAMEKAERIALQAATPAPNVELTPLVISLIVVLCMLVFALIVSSFILRMCITKRREGRAARAGATVKKQTQVGDLFRSWSCMTMTIELRKLKVLRFNLGFPSMFLSISNFLLQFCSMISLITVLRTSIGVNI